MIEVKQQHFFAVLQGTNLDCVEQVFKLDGTGKKDKFAMNMSGLKALGQGKWSSAQCHINERESPIHFCAISVDQTHAPDTFAVKSAIG